MIELAINGTKQTRLEIRNICYVMRQEDTVYIFFNKVIFFKYRTRQNQSYRNE